MPKMHKNPLMAAFSQGNTPTIACFNKATISLGVDFDELIAAMQKFVDQYVAPVWGTPAKLERSLDFVPGAWAMVFLNDADQPNALAYHDLTPDGLPVSKVFVRTTLQNNDLVSVSATHELVEMLVDPAINLLTTGPDPEATYAYESADPVESLSFKIDGIDVTDFVFPSYFEGFHEPGSVQFDYMNKVSEPFQILSGGYQLVFKGGRWTQETTSAAKAKALAAEDRRGHRSTQRAAVRLVRSTPTSNAAAAAIAPNFYSTILEVDFKPGMSTMSVVASSADPYALRRLTSFNPVANSEIDAAGLKFTRTWQYELLNEKSGRWEKAGIYQS